jgi:hypothetical protein
MLDYLLWAILGCIFLAFAVGYYFGRNHDPEWEHYDNGWEDQ